MLAFAASKAQVASGRFDPGQILDSHEYVTGAEGFCSRPNRLGAGPCTGNFLRERLHLLGQTRSEFMDRLKPWRKAFSAA